MLKLIETNVYKEEEVVVRCYAADFMVQNVHVEGINTFTYKDGNIEVHVIHDTDYVYSTALHDEFETAISEALGFAVIFTEAGMQDVGLASMEIK